jgi:topoisomerase-4 subunit A
VRDQQLPRYIEARLSKFALESFQSKDTEWKLTYAGRNKACITTSSNFHAHGHGRRGIAVGLASKILPHNFNELIDPPSIIFVKGFCPLSRLPTGGFIDVQNTTTDRSGVNKGKGLNRETGIRKRLSSMTCLLARNNHSYRFYY